MMSIRPQTSRPKAADQPSPRKVEEKNWSHQAGGSRAFALFRLPLAAGPVQAIPPLLRPPDHGDRGAPEWRLARRLPSRVPHNATDDSLIHLVLACFLVFWLTSAINRIVKEPKPGVVILTPLPHRLFTGSRRYHRPVQAACWHLTPAV